MKKRADAEYFLNVLMFHETFYTLCTGVQGKARHIG